MDFNPAHHFEVFPSSNLAANETADMFAMLAVRQLVDHSITAAPMVQSQHQARQLWSAAPPRQFKAEGAMPAMNGPAPLCDEAEIGLPNERTVSKQPKCIAAEFIKKFLGKIIKLGGLDG